jgi:acetyl-CoA acetyltransferase family protein
MTRAPFVMAKSEKAFARAAAIEDTTIGWRFVNPAMRAAYGVDSMPETAEIVAQEFAVSREDQDAFALRSQQRTWAAQERGYLAGEIVPVDLPAGRGETVTVAWDEHPRPDTTLQGLAKLKAVVRAGGTVTAGNAAGINDGAAALVVASEDAARRYGLEPIARIAGYVAAGVEPRIMGMGPVPATRRLLARTGLGLEDFDVVELNEAFAAQALAVLRELGLADDATHVNANGGAISLGHPLGASGARLCLTAARSLADRKARRALVTMCVGVGQGAAMALEAV